MQNSIQGPLLRTGNNSSFKALGETGYPVFKMAFQLREAIYRLDAGRDLARHLAIPQNDQSGNRTDWYSSFQGDVISWSGATETERASARQQFSEFRMAVQTLSEQMLTAEKSGAGGDRQVFAQLLKSVVHFPDDEFLYLVNGILVITFWGFIHPTGEQRNPMHWLQPSSVPIPPVAPLAQPLAQSESVPAHTTGTVTRTRPWNWRWLLWLLLALLFIALLLGLLRGCVPSFSLGLPGFSGEKNLSQPISENSKTVEGNLPTIPTKKVSETASETNTVSIPATATQAQDDVQPPKTADSPAPEATDTASKAPAPADNSEPLDTEPATNVVPPLNTQMPDSEPQKPAVVPHAAPSEPPTQDPLTLPPALPDGPAQFLNGQWRVNGGIQDKLTGRPLQLEYNFDQGNGTVSVRQSNNVTCTGAAKGSVQQGALHITNPEQMQCSDGSNFIGPTIECKSPASGDADCVGNNDGDKTFPIRMLQPKN
ncbi:SrfA family protein [Pectobacterium polaris]|uniref:SrfA family protein n=1 Tax=Pectobacterium polaris TaxID=2042057 RepID=UPI002404B8B7|nr:SrfA family protein [Pectobacterium polaris]MDG0803612.1 SrfA family protein [Pectobacterium polaris]